MVLFAGSIRAEALWPEIFLPGYHAFRNDSYWTGSLLLAGRLLTLFGAYQFHNRYVNYSSAARAAENADLVYGPGLEYADPYSGDYLSSQDLQNRAGRSQNYFHMSVALHLGLTAAGLFQGYQIAEDTRERNLKRLEIQPAVRSTPIGIQYTWRLDF